MKIKKVPLRKCITCGQNKEKKDLIRIVRDKDKNIIVDISGRANGRGAYMCIDNNCLEKAEKTKKLSRTLKVEIPNHIYEDLKNAIKLKSKE